MDGSILADRHAAVLRAPFGVKALASPPPSVGERQADDRRENSLENTPGLPSAVMGWLQFSSGVPVCHVATFSGVGAMVGVQHTQAPIPLDLEVDDLPGV